MKIKDIFYITFVKSWWVIAFTFLCLIFYEQGLRNRKFLHHQLSQELADCRLQKCQALKEQQDLESQINSQSDLAWLELMLIKGLGVVPEGYQKVYFFPEEDSSKI